MELCYSETVIEQRKISSSLFLEMRKLMVDENKSRKEDEITCLEFKRILALKEKDQL